MARAAPRVPELFDLDHVAGMERKLARPLLVAHHGLIGETNPLRGGLLAHHEDAVTGSVVGEPAAEGDDVSEGHVLSDLERSGVRHLSEEKNRHRLNVRPR